jgi:hypothetical protein
MRSQLIRHRTALGLSLDAHAHFKSRFMPQLVDDSYTSVPVEIGCADLRAYTAASSKDRGTDRAQVLIS